MLCSSFLEMGNDSKCANSSYLKFIHSWQCTFLGSNRAPIKREVDQKEANTKSKKKKRKKRKKKWQDRDLFIFRKFPKVFQIIFLSFCSFFFLRHHWWLTNILSSNHQKAKLISPHEDKWDEGNQTGTINNRHSLTKNHLNINVFEVWSSSWAYNKILSLLLNCKALITHHSTPYMLLFSMHEGNSY